jgi:hypothetical protein
MSLQKSVALTTWYKGIIPLYIGDDRMDEVGGIYDDYTKYSESIPTPSLFTLYLTLLIFTLDGSPSPSIKTPNLHQIIALQQFGAIGKMMWVRDWRQLIACNYPEPHVWVA